MKTVLVTGGAGFIGSNFVRYLLSQAGSFRVVVLDKLTYAGSRLNLRDILGDRRIRFVRGDIADSRSLRRLFAKCRPDYVYNFAAESHVDRSIEGPRNFVHTNILGTFELLEAARSYLKSAGKTRRRFRLLHVSTDEVYGSLGKKGTFSEEAPYAPNSPYAASKAGADHLARVYHRTYGLPILLTNCSNNYGPHQFPEKLIPLTILNALEGRSLPLYGDGGNVRDWLYVEDHCEALWKVMKQGRAGEKYNIGGGNERTNSQVVDLICRLLERTLPAAENKVLAGRGISSYSALKVFVRDRPGHDRRYAIDSGKIRREVGWKPRHDFNAGVQKTIRWYMENLDWSEKVQKGKYRRERLGLAT